RMTLPLLGAVKRVGSILKGIDETTLAVVTLPGMMANVLPWPELSTNRASRTSGARPRRRRTRVDCWNVFIGPPWPAAEVSREESRRSRGARPIRDGPAPPLLVAGHPSVIVDCSKTDPPRRHTEREPVLTDGQPPARRVHPLQGFRLSRRATPRDPRRGLP